MRKLTHITLHGVLSEQVGRQHFDLAASSVGEAMRGIQANCKTLYKSLIENDEKNIKYRVLINKKDFLVEEGKDPNTEEGIRSSELAMKFKELKTIDIVPVMEGEKGGLKIYFRNNCRNYINSYWSMDNQSIFNNGGYRIVSGGGI